MPRRGHRGPRRLMPSVAPAADRAGGTPARRVGAPKGGHQGSSSGCCRCTTWLPSMRLLDSAISAVALVARPHKPIARRHSSSWSAGRCRATARARGSRQDRTHDRRRLLRDGDARAGDRSFVGAGRALGGLRPHRADSRPAEGPRPRRCHRAATLGRYTFSRAPSQSQHSPGHAGAHARDPGRTRHWRSIAGRRRLSRSRPTSGLGRGFRFERVAPSTDDWSRLPRRAFAVWLPTR